MLRLSSNLPICVQAITVTGLIRRTEYMVVSNHTKNNWTHKGSLHSTLVSMKSDGTFGALTYSDNTVKETINYYPFGSEMKMQDPAQMAGDTWQPYRFTRV